MEYETRETYQISKRIKIFDNTWINLCDTYVSRKTSKPTSRKTQLVNIAK